MCAADPNNQRDPSNPGPAEREIEDNPESTVAERRPKEIGGRDGPDPTRYGDWEKHGRCIDF